MADGELAGVAGSAPGAIEGGGAGDGGHAFAAYGGGLGEEVAAWSK
jgi:hypothetical protein